MLKKRKNGKQNKPITGQTCLTNYFVKKDGLPSTTTTPPTADDNNVDKIKAKCRTTTPVKSKARKSNSLKLKKRKVMKIITPSPKLKQRRIELCTPPVKNATPTKLAYVIDKENHLMVDLTSPGKCKAKRHLFDKNETSNEQVKVEEVCQKQELINLEDTHVNEEEMDCDLLLNDLPIGWDIDKSHDDHMIPLPDDDRMLPLRYRVQNVEWQSYSDQNNLKYLKEQIVLQLVSGNGDTAVCYLRDDWIQTDVRIGDVIHIVGSCSSSLCNPDHAPSLDHYVVSNDTSGCVIINPDHLISCTSIANGITCTRKAILNELFKGHPQHNEAMLLGKLLHELFQKVLIGGSKATEEYIQSLIPSIVSNISILDELYVLDLSEEYVTEQLEEYVPLIMKWCNEYQHDLSGDDCKIEWKRIISSNAELMKATINEVVDIEENIWCPRFGLKGKVDATVKLKIGTADEYLVPFELKTGQMIGKYGLTQHRAQVVLYCLMLCDSHMTPVPAGLLHYLKPDTTLTVFSPSNETRALLIARNHLARYHGNHWDHVTLPEMLQESKTCKRCPMISQCSLHHKCFENGTPESSGLGEYYPASVDHMTPKWVEFYRHWYRLMAEEMSYEQNKELMEKVWRKSTRERVGNGTCISKLLPCQPELSEEGFHFYKIKQCFKRTDSNSNFHTFTVNDRVFVSRLDGRGWAVAMGYILSLNPDSITLVLDKSVPCDTEYCIDINSTVHNDNVALYALASVCTSDSEREHQLRELVIDLKPPRFKSDVVFTDYEQQLLRSLNIDQRNAIRNVLLCRDYSLILGMPGTGKTTTISCLIQLLIARGYSILLTTFTNSAVDNVLVKLLQSDIDFVRLGSAIKVHPLISGYTVRELTKNCTCVQDLKNVYSNKLLVATTCHSLDHAVLTHKQFDYCIMDEATQLHLPLSLAPIRLASRFVLVGDHYQLPPLVQSPIAREGGYEESLFKRLSNSHPETLTSLTHQHRMNKDIMELSNRLIYNNVLRCASEDVAMATMRIPDDGWERKVEFDWLKRAVDPGNSVVFLNTDKCGAELEERTCEQICNSFEVEKVIQIVQTLTELGVSPCDILVITPYKHQQKLIQKQLSVLTTEGESHSHTSRTGSHSPRLWNECVEVLTVDKCQGKDRSCVIMSLVRSNTNGKVGSLLLNWQRINVSLTRAKHKLIFIGSCTTLSNSPYINQLILLVNTRQCTIDIS